MMRLEKLYQEKIVPHLMEEFKYSSPWRYLEY